MGPAWGPSGRTQVGPMVDPWTLLSGYCTVYWNSFLTSTVKEFMLCVSHRNSVSNYRHHDCLLNGFLQAQIKENIKLRIAGLCEGIQRWQVNSLHKGSATWKMFPFDDVIMDIHGVLLFSGGGDVWPETEWLGFQARCTRHRSQIRHRQRQHRPPQQGRPVLSQTAQVTSQNSECHHSSRM